MALELATAIGATWDEMWQYERAALCALAHLHASCADARWRALTAEQHYMIVRAWRAAIDLGTCCAATVLKVQRSLPS